MSDAGNEGKAAFAQEEDGGEQYEDSCSCAADDARFIEDFEVLFHGGVGSLGSGTEFLDLLVTVGTSGDFVNESRMLLESHVFNKSGTVPDVRT
jgi:hypothetical protein